MEFCLSLSPVSPTWSRCRGLRKPAWMLAVPYVPCVPYRKSGLANFDAASVGGDVTVLPEFEPLGLVRLWPMHAPCVPYLGLSARGWWGYAWRCVSSMSPKFLGQYKDAWISIRWQVLPDPFPPVVIRAHGGGGIKSLRGENRKPTVCRHFCVREFWMGGVPTVRVMCPSK